jgi:hypothetical protein
MNTKQKIFCTIIFAALLAPLVVNADDAETLEGFTPKINDVTVTIYNAKDIMETCSTEAARFGNPPYPKEVMACTTYDIVNKSCTIFVPVKVSIATLGHELKHCFLGNFHDHTR